MKLANTKIIKTMTKHGGEVVKYLSKNSPTILTGCAVAGAVAAVGLAIKATKPALDHIREEKIEHRDRIIIPDGDEREDFDLTEEEIDAIQLKPTEVIKAVWKDYIPTAIVLGGTTACIIGAHSISAKRTAAMAALYTMSEQALKDYKTQTEKVVGKSKADKIHDAVMEEELKRHPYDEATVIPGGSGKTLMFDPLSGRYFEGDIETLRHTVNTLREQINGGMDTVSQNEYYWAISEALHVDLCGVTDGETRGWSVDNLLELKFTSSLTSNARPVLVVGFTNGPVPWYQNC